MFVKANNIVVKENMFMFTTIAIALAVLTSATTSLITTVLAKVAWWKIFKFS